jgi:putative serine protease PepD
MKFFKSTVAKVGVGFAAGALLVGGISNAAISPSIGAKACVDNKTGAMYLAKNSTCSANRTLTTISGNSIDVSAIAALATPSVVSIAEKLSSGTGTGSGWIYKSNGSTTYIVTNNHVVADFATSTGGTLTVELNNGDQYPATIVGRDSNYDLAVIKINKGNLPELELGDSTKLVIGDPVVAIGSPLGLSSTVTSGIISAQNRPVTTGSTGAESYVDAIQTDAAINPGNSGGALLDANGRIIGINSAIASLSSGQSGSIGLGFSIPISEAKRTIDELISTGKSTRPVLGIFFDTTYTGVGAKIGKLSSGEGAEKAGIPAGAIIKSIDGLKITDQVAAIVKIRSYAPGAKVVVVVELPSGSSKTFTVTLGSAPSN